MKKLWLLGLGGIWLLGGTGTGCQKTPLPEEIPAIPRLILLTWDGIRVQDFLLPEGKPDPTKVPLLAAWWADSSSQTLISFNFWHEGFTYTMAGHLALLSGQHVPIANNSRGIPPAPHLLHQILETYSLDHQRVWIVASKDKLCNLRKCRGCTHISLPEGTCGFWNPWGPADAIALGHALDLLMQVHPVVMMIALAGPDVYAHAGLYSSYVEAIRQCDHHTATLWRALENSPYYRDRTLLVVTTDHGRHIYDFRGHGDGCEGCRRLFLVIKPVGTVSLPARWDSLRTKAQRHERITHQDLHCFFLEYLRVGSCVR